MVHVAMASTDGDAVSDVSLEHRDDVSTTVEVIEAISAVTGTPVEELPPLRDVVDTDALNAISTPQSAATDVAVSFTYADYEVTVTSGGPITVDPIDA